MELPVLVVAFLVIVALILVPVLRRIILLALRLAIFVAVGAAALAGVAMLMNNETIFEKPGAHRRIARFLTMNSAATTLSGAGAATCARNENPAAAPLPVAASTPATTRSRRRAARKVLAPENQTPANPPGAERIAQAMATPAPLDDVFPELIRRGFPGISRQKLFELSEKTVSSLAGWQIVKTDPRTFTLDCIYTTRILRFQDDVRITVEPSGDIDVCSSSGTARPESTSMLRYFPGDLGANIGHIKEFYEVLEPQMDQIYKEEQDKENARKPR